MLTRLRAPIGVSRPIEPVLQRKPNDNKTARVVPESVYRTLRSPGQPVDRAVRAQLEPLLGFDFAGIRIHADHDAARSAAEVKAQAYTVGSHIVFGAEAPRPHETSSHKLMAHELTHASQQRPWSGQRIELGDVSDPAEAHADATADRVLAGLAAGPQAKAAQHSVLRRKQSPNTADQVNQVGSRESAQVIGESQRGPDELIKELEGLVQQAVWLTIRKRVYPKESAAGIARARQRHDKQLPELAGLGRISAAENFAAAMHNLQDRWAPLSPQRRVEFIKGALDRELAAAHIPKLISGEAQNIPENGQFIPQEWQIVIKEALVHPATLSNDSAALLANTGLHEARHAEQKFLEARFAAKVMHWDHAALTDKLGIHPAIATAALSAKSDPIADAGSQTLGKQLYESRNKPSGNPDDGISDLESLHDEAQNFLRDFQVNPTPSKLASARALCTKLRQQITLVEQRYHEYRTIPKESDAHEVGDTAELAFRGWSSAWPKATP